MRAKSCKPAAKSRTFHSCRMHCTPAWSTASFHPGTCFFRRSTSDSDSLGTSPPSQGMQRLDDRPTISLIASGGLHTNRSRVVCNKECTGGHTLLCAPCLHAQAPCCQNQWRPLQQMGHEHQNSVWDHRCASDGAHKRDLCTSPTSARSMWALRMSSLRAGSSEPRRGCMCMGRPCWACWWGMPTCPCPKFFTFTLIPGCEQRAVSGPAAVLPVVHNVRPRDPMLPQWARVPVNRPIILVHMTCVCCMAAMAVR